MKETQIVQELKDIKKQLIFIKRNMIDKDMVLSQDDIDSLTETAKEKKQSKLISLEQIKKELGCN